jgi:iron complex transport system substrate-binding protein
VFGFSDLQADIASQLIRAGIQVTVFNQRSVDEIFSMLYQVAAMVGEADQAEDRLNQMRDNLSAIQAAAANFKHRPKIYFEEWDEPRISCIRWVSELITVAGGADCFPELAHMPMGKDRIIAHDQSIVDRAPDIIIGSWCGKKFRSEKVSQRPGWVNIPAVKNNQLFEIKSADILQPGPAALTDGVAQLHQIVQQWQLKHA